MSTSDFQADIAAIERIDAVPRILDVVCHSTGMGFAAIARVTNEQWICCAVQDTIDFGLRPGGELKLETTICNEIRQHRQPVIIDHVAEDEVFVGHATPALYGFQSYISVPIKLTNGTFFGTLCAIDPRPARLKNPETVGMFTLFAELIASHLDTIEKLDAIETKLMTERQTSELREQFIAVLGHDLRNPLASIAASARMIPKATSKEATVEIISLMQSSVSRISRLIDDVLDFARGRLGGGVALRKSSEPIGIVLEQVVAELHASNPGRVIDANFDLSMMVVCDSQRIGQLFSNLLGNAITHGAPDRPIDVHATKLDGVFELSVANAGDPIPPDAIKRLFQPFYRGDAQASMQGLGLGLYIASEIARAHGGALSVESSIQRTCFTFSMPAA